MKTTQGDIYAGDSFPPSIGRGSGMTLKVIAERLRQWSRRQPGVRHFGWTRRAQRDEIRRRAALEAAMVPAPAPGPRPDLKSALALPCGQ